MRPRSLFSMMLCRALSRVSLSVVLGWGELLFKLGTNSKGRLGHLEKRTFGGGWGGGQIILIEVLVAKITLEVLFKKLHFQKTHIGLVT